jgi:hypothetical protein
LIWHRLRWPREVTPEQALQLARLLASAGGTPLVIESVGTAGRVEHRLALPEGRAESLVDQLRAALPGLAIELGHDRPPLPVTRAIELRLSTRLRSLRSDDLAAISRVLLTALAHAHQGEYLSLQWVLARRQRPTAVPNHLTGATRESWWSALLLAPFSAPPADEGEIRNALRVKHAEPGWYAVGRIGVKANHAPRERLLIGQVLGSLRQSEAPGVHWWAKPTPPKRLEQRHSGWRPPLRLNASELAAVSAWPVGSTGELPVDRLASRLVAPSTAIPRTGRIVGKASFPGRERPLALTPKDSLRHLEVLGPTGVGKSTLLLNLITHDLAAGRAVVVIEPRGDLIADVLARVPEHRVKDVVLLDPTDATRPVGLNPLASGGRSPELVADQVLGLFHALYAAHWGPRTQDILGSALLSLARTPGMTLAALVPLLTDANFRRRVVGKLADDPLGLGSFWRTFEGWREAERLNAIAPTMNKLRPLLLRPDLRAIIGQAHPRFALRQVFSERKILLVNLAAGQVGPETANLLGGLVISQLWQAILGRSAIPREQRHPVMVVLDEFQTYLHLPVDLSDALVQARGLGVGFTLAHQFLRQLGTDMRAAVLANAQSKLAFRLPHDDARLLAAGSWLASEDFQELAAFEAYGQLVAHDTVQPWCSLRTLPPSEAISEAEAVRAASRERYGMNRDEIEHELTQLVRPARSPATDDLMPRRRQHPNGDAS